MNRDNDRQTSIILAVLGILPIVWLGLLIAPSVKGGLPEILPSLMNVMSDPFHIVLCEDSVKTVLVLLLCYGMGIGIFNLIINDAIRKIASLSQTVVIGILKPNENEGGNRYDQAGKR